MKKNLLLFFALLLFGWQNAYAALPDGSYAEDWTLTDLNGTTHNLYTHLDAGMPVIIDFSATWCGPCWSYHTSGIMEDLYHDYGPSGTDEIRVFYIEADGSTNTNCLYGSAGCSGGTQGDWVTGTPYPIIDLIGPDLSVRSDYNVTYYPTIYGISPDRRTWEVGQASYSTWESWLLESFALEATANITPSTCGNNGSIEILATGGSGSLSYNWDNGASGSIISDLSEGIYTVTISDGNGYYIERQYTVDGPFSGAPLGMNIVSLLNVDCNGNWSGEAEVEGVDGNYGYSYEWENGTTGSYISGLPAGDHTVSITDAEGCTEEFEVTIDEPEILFSYSIVTDDACGLGNGEVFLVPSGGTAPHYFDIGNGPEPVDNFFDLTAGTYDYIHTDANGCIYNDQFEVQLVGVPTAVASAQGDLDCSNNSVTVSGSGSSTGSGYDYMWTTTNGNITSDPTQIDITVDQPGDYKLVVTNSSYGCSEESSDSVVELVSPPNADAGQASTLTCNVTSIVLDGSSSDTGSDYTYLWTTMDGNIVSDETTLTPTVDQAGTYTLAVTNSTNGCVTTSEVVVPSDYAKPSVSASDAELTCSTTDVQICASYGAGSTISWSTPDGTVTDSCIMVTAAGMYVATATGANGCSATDTSSVTQSADLPQTSIATPEMITCTTPQIMLEGSLVGDIMGHTIVWTTSNGNIVDGENTLTPTVDQGGSYVMSVTNTSNSCTSQVTIDVTADVSLPMASFDFDATPGSLTLNNTSLNFDGNVTWDLGNGETAQGDTVQVDFDETGIYTICVNVENECGPNQICQDIQFVTIMSLQSSTSDVLCFGDSNGQIDVSPTGGLSPYEITWTGPNGYQSDQLSISDLEPGVYTMILKDSDSNEIMQGFTVGEPDELLSTVNAIDVSCFGGNDGMVDIVVTGGVGPYTYNINTTELEAGSYDLIVSDMNECTTESSFEINQPAEIVNLNTSTTDASAGQANGSITIEPSGGTGQISVSWDNGMTGSAISDLEAGFYTPTLTDENDCSVVLDPIEVKSASNIEGLEFVNNFVLSPNPASINVNLDLSLNGQKDLNVYITNALGQITYSNTFNGITNLNTSIDVSQFDAGLYFLSIKSGNQIASQRFIVVK